MTVKLDEIFEACELVARQENLNICVTESLKGAGVVGAVAFISGVIFGPVGLAVGGAVGGLAGCAMCKKFVPLGQILNEMKQEDKNRLSAHMMSIVQNLDVADGIMLIALISNPESTVKGQFIKHLTSYFSQSVRQIQVFYTNFLSKEVVCGMAAKEFIERKTKVC